MALEVDIRENERFEDSWFIASSVAIIIMAVAVLAALTGILGDGPLAKGRATIPGTPDEVRFERVLRVQTPSRLDIHIDAPLARPVAEVHLDRAFLHTRDIKDMLPHPDGTRVEDDGSTFLFALGPDRKGLIKIWITPTTPGPARGIMAINGATVPLSQFILP